MHIDEIAAQIQATYLSKGPDFEINTINYDSRKSTGSDNELFIALKGLKNDGHKFLTALYHQGVRNFLVSVAIDSSLYPGANILQVKDPLQSIQHLASSHRRHFKIPVIGITGSNGKTIVKEWLTTLLEQQWHVIKNPKSFNSQLGVPLSVWQIENLHEIAVFEAGVSKAGEMSNLQEIIRPAYGIFTNIGEAHAEGFASLSEKIREKTLLFTNCDQVLCRKSHSQIVESLKKNTKAKVVTWDFDDTTADLNYTCMDERYHVLVRGKELGFTVPFRNAHDLENIFHAVSMALLLNEDPEKIQRALDKVRPVPMRLQLKRGINDTYILDDSYNNDLLGLATALEYLEQQPRKKKKTVVLSDILQSGRKPRDLYTHINLLLTKHNITRLIGVGPQISSCKDLFEMQCEVFASTNDLLHAVPDFKDEFILIKGARDFNLEKIAAYLEEKSHGTVLEVNFESLVHNLNAYRRRLGPDTKLMVMVKAFAYGAGVNEVAHLLQYHRVDYLGVAYLDEAIELRKKGITLPVMIMNPEADSFSLLETFNLEPEIYSIQMLRSFINNIQDPPPIHLKMETGMNRLGFGEEDLPELLSLLKANEQVRIKGIFTHFSSSDDPQEDQYTAMQAERFQRISEKIIQTLGYRPFLHALNSSGIARWPQYQFDMVRLGIGLYGYDSAGVIPDLDPISVLKTKVSQVKKVKKGDSIGYSRKGRADRDGAVATLAIGYADGYSRLFGNGNAYVLINGQRAQTIGNVCMDMTMVDVTGLQVREGDEAIIFGKDPSIGDLAKWSQTIPYEILTNISQRVKRVFVSE